MIRACRVPFVITSTSASTTQPELALPTTVPTISTQARSGRSPAFELATGRPLRESTRWSAFQLNRGVKSTGSSLTGRRSRLWEDRSHQRESQNDGDHLHTQSRFRSDETRLLLLDLQGKPIPMLSPASARPRSRRPVALRTRPATRSRWDHHRQLHRLPRPPRPLKSSTYFTGQLSRKTAAPDSLRALLPPCTLPP
jgi:hypothetical protein